MDAGQLTKMRRWEGGEEGEEGGEGGRGKKGGGLRQTCQSGAVQHLPHKKVVSEKNES